MTPKSWHDSNPDRSARTAEGIRLRVAILGDVEPKPEPSFGNFRRAIDAVNGLAEAPGIDFVVSVGDVAHRGTRVQYEAASRILQDLQVPIYAIAGNEELQAGPARFLRYAAAWNGDGETIPGLHYVVEHAGVVFLFATAQRNGIDFQTQELEWMANRLGERPALPAVVVTHAPAQATFPDGKTMAETAFNRRILALPNVVATVSGHSHLDLDACLGYVRDAFGVHHIHAPGLERTKVGDHHVPRLRLLTVTAEGRSYVETLNLASGDWEERHRVVFGWPVG